MNFEVPINYDYKLSKDEYYLYFFLDPRTPKFEKGNYVFPHEVFYVGKGKGKRYLVENKRNSEVEQRIKEI